MLCVSAGGGGGGGGEESASRGPIEAALATSGARGSLVSLASMAVLTMAAGLAASLDAPTDDGPTIAEAERTPQPNNPHDAAACLPYADGFVFVRAGPYHEGVSAALHAMDSTIRRSLALAATAVAAVAPAPREAAGAGELDEEGVETISAVDLDSLQSAAAAQAEREAAEDKKRRDAERKKKKTAAKNQKRAEERAAEAEAKVRSLLCMPTCCCCCRVVIRRRRRLQLPRARCPLVMKALPQALSKSCRRRQPRGVCAMQFLTVGAAQAKLEAERAAQAEILRVAEQERAAAAAAQRKAEAVRPKRRVLFRDGRATVKRSRSIVVLWKRFQINALATGCEAGAGARGAEGTAGAPESAQGGGGCGGAGQGPERCRGRRAPTTRHSCLPIPCHRLMLADVIVSRHACRPTECSVLAGFSSSLMSLRCWCARRLRRQRTTQRTAISTSPSSPPTYRSHRQQPPLPPRPQPPRLVVGWGWLRRATRR
eukprot:COSAG04_NODE_2083_length_4835_cov_2.135980_2_plen_485_part_00